MTASLSVVSTEMAGLVEASAAGVVGVEARRRMPASGLVWSADGLIVTANHVVRRDDEIFVGLPDGERAPATLVGRNAAVDVALLRVDVTGLDVRERIGLEELHVGNIVLALGRPGKSVQATLGIVSALAGPWQTPAGGLMEGYLQTDVLMYPGFSGGPLVEAGGRVAGITTSALVRGTSLAVPAGTLETSVNALLEHGHIPRGYLGVSLHPVRLPDALQEELGQETGLMLMSVEAGAPAAEAGAVQGDVIVSLGDAQVRHIDDLQAQMGPEQVGQSVEIGLVRGGQLQRLSVTVGQR